MRRISNITTGLALLFTVCAAAHATVTVQLTEGSGSVVQHELISGKWRIVVESTANASPTRWLIRGNAADNIQYISIYNNSTGGQHTFVTVESTPSTSGLNNVEEIKRITNLRDVLITKLDINGDLGDVEVTNIIEARVRGDVVGDIVLGERGAGGTSPLTQMHVDGDVLGNVTTEFGEIRDLRIDGDFGSVSVAPTISANHAIRLLRVEGDVYGDVDANAFGFNAPIGRFEFGGSVYGEVKGRTFDDFSGFVSDPLGVYIDDDLEGSILFSHAVSDVVIVGGSFGEDASVTFPTNGLLGQVTFNNNDDGGLWEGDVVVGATSLGEAYAATAASIGGGAAGLAPFTHHGTSCAPTDGSVIFIKSIDIFDPESGCLDHYFTQAKVRLYGPVELVGAAPHVEVLVWSGSAYVDAGFTVVTSIVSSTGEREVLVKRSGDHPWPEGEYRIVPLEDKMISKGVVGDPDVDMFEYEFTLADGCQLLLLQNFDFNEDQTVCELDFLEWSSDPCDLNNDEVVDCDDIAVMLSAIDLYETLTAE